MHRHRENEITKRLEELSERLKVLESRQSLLTLGFCDWVVKCVCIAAALACAVFEISSYRRAAAPCLDTRAGGSAVATRTRFARMHNGAPPDMYFRGTAEATVRLRFQCLDSSRVQLSSTSRHATFNCMTTTAASIAIDCRTGEKRGC